MRILVIPDVHLKPFMFDQAAGLLKKGEADRAVCLMDIADDWGQQYNLDLYVQTYDAAIRFAKEFPALSAMPSLWTRSFFVSTAGDVSAQTIQRYVETQKTRP